MEHRVVMEEHIGNIIGKEFDVHHKNGKKDDNRIGNLEILTHAEHTLRHGNLDTFRSKTYSRAHSDK